MKRHEMIGDMIAVIREAALRNKSLPIYLLASLSVAASPAVTVIICVHALILKTL